MTVPPRDRISTLGLVTATFFIVSGGPYGLEEIVLGHGYRGAILLLLVVPVLWSLPVALMVGELGAAMPATGGYYVWVRRALGTFWGLQEAWLSLTYGIVNVAIYPVLLVSYLERFWPGIGPSGAWWISLASVALGTGINALGIRSVGRSSTALSLLLLVPFAVLVAIALVTLPHGGLGAMQVAFAQPPPTDPRAIAAGFMLAMWNLMGFDNASTFAAEVDDPARSYPRAMVLAAALIVLVYLAPLLASATTGLPASAWSSGTWVEVGAQLGGRTLAAAITAGGVISALGLFVAQLLSWSRLPVALAEDRWLPPWIAARHPRSHAPVRAVLLGGVLAAVCVGFGLRQLVEINVLLYGAGLVLELVALVLLRVREPGMPRPFRIPGGAAALAAIALLPTALLAMAAWLVRDEPGPLGMSAAGFSVAVALLGPAWWAVGRSVRRGPTDVEVGRT